MTAEMTKIVLEYALHFLAAQKFGKALPVNPPDWMHLAHVNIALEELKSWRPPDSDYENAKGIIKEFTQALRAEKQPHIHRLGGHSGHTARTCLDCGHIVKRGE